MDISLSGLVPLTWMLPAAYLLGSIPTAVWTGKIFHGIDVRDHGSGNAGATNVMRVLGVKTGIPVLALDMIKGWLAVTLVVFQSSFHHHSEIYTVIAILLGTLAVTGHIFPIFAGFRGGKGVATIAGVCFGLHPLGTLSALAVFVLALVIWKYVSVGSMAAGISFPVWVILVYSSDAISLWIFSVAASLILIFTHRKNIQRLLKGEEGKATFLFRKKIDE